jgi:hypothetical protein
VVHTVIPSTCKAEVGELRAEASPGQKYKALSEKQTDRTGSGAQAVEHLPSKCKALSSNPSSAKKNQKNNSEFRSSWILLHEHCINFYINFNF